MRSRQGAALGAALSLSAALLLSAALPLSAARAEPSRAELLRAHLSAAPEARALTRREEGVIDWSERAVSAVGVGTPRLLSPTGGLATEDLAAVALRDAERRLVALVGALLSLEGGAGSGEADAGGCKERLRDVAARRAAESTPPARFSDGTAHLRARLALSEVGCGEPMGLPIAWVEVPEGAPEGALLAPLTTPSGAPKGSMIRRFFYTPARAEALRSLRAQVGVSAPISAALEGVGEGARLRLSASVDAREVWVWAPASSRGGSQ